MSFFFFWFFLQYIFKVARNEVKNPSFAQRSAHRDSRIWRPELIEPAAERKLRPRGRRPTFKSAYPDPQILPQCNISFNYPLLGRVKKNSCLSSEIFDEIRAGGRIFFYFLYTVYVGCVNNPAARCVTVGVAVHVAASVTGSTGSAADTWPTLTKIKTQQEYIRIPYVLLLIKNPARAIRPHNGNSSIHQVPTLSIFLALFYPYACNGPPSGMETVHSETC